MNCFDLNVWILIIPINFNHFQKKMPRCCICKGPDARFRWPSKPDRVSEWLKIFKKKELKEKEKNYRLCAKHFARSDMYYSKMGKLVLSREANPLELYSHRNPEENTSESMPVLQDNSPPSQSYPNRIEKPGLAKLKYL